MKFIATGDWHLRGDIPRSVKVEKTEDWIELQMENLQQIFDIAHKEKIDDIVVAGDVFNTYSEPQILVNKTLLKLKNRFGMRIHAIAGNHDLPYHSMVNLNSSSFGILFNGGAFSLIDDFDEKRLFIGASFGVDEILRETKTDLLVMHRLVAPKNTFPPDVKIDDPESIFAEFPNAENIIVGDYHHAFIAHKLLKARKNSKGKLLVPGCIGRQAIDMENYECKVWVCDLTDGVLTAEPRALKPLWELERVGGTEIKRGLADAFVSLSTIAFDYRDRIMAEENLKPLTKPQIDLVHEIIHRSA
jgi:predicted phosphodiesterase